MNEEKNTVKEVCGTCDGAGVVDSGGSEPWGTWINIPCPECNHLAYLRLYSDKEAEERDGCEC